MMLTRIGTLVDTLGWRSRYRRFQSGWPAKSRPDIGYVKTGKARYRYRVAGAGRPIVFVADPPVTLEAYDTLLNELAPHFRVIVLEAAAMGFSVATNAYCFGFRETNDDIAEAIGQLAEEPAILAFSCVSGLGAIDIAVRYPERVAGLFLMTVTSWNGFQRWVARRDPKGLLRKPVLGQIGMMRLARGRAPAWFAVAVGREEMVAPLCRCAEDGFNHGMRFPLASAFQRYLAGPDPLGTPTQPVTLFWGRGDRSHDEESIELSRAIAPQAKIVTDDVLGHFPELESPAEMAQRIRAFADHLPESRAVVE